MPMRLTIVVEFPNVLSSRAEYDVKKAVLEFSQDVPFGNVVKAELVTLPTPPRETP